MITPVSLRSCPIVAIVKINNPPWEIQLLLEWVSCVIDAEWIWSSLPNDENVQFYKHSCQINQTETIAQCYTVFHIRCSPQKMRPSSKCRPQQTNKQTRNAFGKKVHLCYCVVLLLTRQTHTNNRSKYLSASSFFHGGMGCPILPSTGLLFLFVIRAVFVEVKMLSRLNHNQQMIKNIFRYVC